MRLIDADRIVYSWHIDADGEEHDGVTLQSIIKKMPTIDAVEVVRCKDCKHMKYAIDKAKNGMCGVHSALIIMNGNDYCSYGERKENVD